MPRPVGIALAATLLALASGPVLAQSAIADAQLATGLPDAVFVPGYGIGYSTGAYPPPSDVVGPGGATFGPEGPAYPPAFPVVVQRPPYDPSPTSIYGVASAPGTTCQQVRGLAPGAYGVHWTTSCEDDR